jgi:hypothetical protein
VEHCLLQDFPQDHEPAAERFDEGESGFVSERRGNKWGRLCRDVAPKQHDASAEPQERLESGEKLLLDAHGANGNCVVCFVQLGSCQQILSPCGFDSGIAKIEMTNGFTEEG